MSMYEFVLTGKTPILFHADDVMASDKLAVWRKDPKNKSISVPGDDRSPAWTWQTYLYNDNEHLVMPVGNLMACLRKAASQMTLKGMKSFKEVSQSGLFIEGEHCNFFGSDGKHVSLASLKKLGELPFAEQMQGVKELGFELLVKRAAVGTSKHVRVRAMFKAWSVAGQIEVTQAVITKAALQQMFDIAGKNVGLLDWRPGGKTPGTYGMFDVELKAA